MQRPAPMRPLVLLALAAPTVATTTAMACPEATEVSTEGEPATTSPCMNQVEFGRVRSVLELGYAVGAGGTTRSGVGQVANAYAGLELGYGLQFGGDDAQPSYELELSAGAAGHQSGGDVKATGLTTRAGVRLGPARLTEAVIDDGRGNFAFFPLTMELAHAGELAARPRLSARPELDRSLYGRERVELATRIIRVEGAGEKATDAAPGLTEPKKATAWAVDVIPLHAGVDIAMQDSTRFETTIGGSMLGVTEHTTNTSVDVLGIEHRRIDSMTGTLDLDTLWVMRVDGVDPVTGSQYYVGWGEVIAMPEIDAVAEKVDPENKTISIGGVGWFSRRTWGGFGAQYKREPFATMTGAVALEDRVSGEIYIPSALGLVARVFGARTTRLVGDELRHDMTAGVEVNATYEHDGFSSKLGVEVGRTYYTALDDAMPEAPGFAASLGLTLQHTGSRSWRR